MSAIAYKKTLKDAENAILYGSRAILSVEEYEEYFDELEKLSPADVSTVLTPDGYANEIKELK